MKYRVKKVTKGDSSVYYAQYRCLLCWFTITDISFSSLIKEPKVFYSFESAESYVKKLIERWSKPSNITYTYMDMEKK